MTRFLLSAGLAALGAGLAAGSAAAQTVAPPQQDTPTEAAAPPRQEPAQAAASSDSPGDIIITARNRQEALTDVPAAVTAFDAKNLEQHHLQSIDDLASFTPGLTVAESAVSSGGSIFLRGIGSGSSNIFADQSVSINIDGMQVGSLNVRKLGQIDLAQVEVLRGPQALFFGKNSPGGVLSFTSADPKKTPEVELSGSNEFVSGDRYVQLVVSEPLSDSVGIRVVGRYSGLSGYFNIRSVAGTGNPLVIPAPVDSWPSGHESFLRGTLLVDPGNRFLFRLKASYGDSFIRGGSGTSYERIRCPYGAPQGLQPNFPCEVGRDIYLGDAPASALALIPQSVTDDGFGLRKDRQFLGTAEAHYDVLDHLRVTSLTGDYSFNEVDGHNASVGPRATVITPYLPFDMKQFTQELRLTSSFDGPVNFTGGMFYEQRHEYTSQNAIVLITAAPFTLGEESSRQGQNALSAYGQISLKPIDALELSGGLRWSHENKTLRFERAGVDRTANLAKSHLDFGNVSPEFTASYHLDRSVLAFASYKQGFKSGGFDAGYSNGAILKPPYSNNFAEEHVEGFEGGLKGTVGRVFYDLVGYTYGYSNLQVGTYDPTTLTYKTLNAAAARAKGIEFNTTWRTPLRGLALNGSVAYNDARFERFLSGCYVGQTPAAGCDVTLNPATGAYLEQDLSGRRLNNAPAWSGLAGATYTAGLGRSGTLDLSSDVDFSSRYTTNLLQGPNDYQNGYAKLNASIKYTAPNKSFDVLLVGRNLTDHYTISTTSSVTFTGSGSGTAAGRLADTSAVVSRGREVFIELALRPKFLN